ncbi:MAG: circularly permuted type 2 ATP-grasp protein [Chloroflexi bacterium]|nr:circularly permuted type 2 ATP-grasp protein [Chloroflexota bacterium]
MDFDAYRLNPAIYDEMFSDDGSPRRHSLLLHQELLDISLEELSTIQERVTRSFSNEGITFTVYGDEEAEERIIPVDCVPRVLSASEWLHIESGLTQRIAALNLFLQDVYGNAAPVGADGESGGNGTMPRIIADGVIPADMVENCPQYRTEMRGFSAPHGAWVSICGTDIVRTNDGFMVLEDNLRVPSGVSYMIANRKAVKTSFRLLYRQSRVREVEHYGSVLHETLAELAPEGRTDATIALLTPGIYNSAFYEHMFLAQEIGAELVEGRDLQVDNGVVYMRTTKGLRRVDIIYRRVDDDFIDPLVFRKDSLLGVPGLIDAYKRGNVTMVNAPGTGVADDKSVYAFVPDMIRYYLGEEPILASVETYLCRRPQDLEYTLDNLDKLVVKRVGESGGYGMLIGAHATQAERDEYAEQILADPADFISQPTLDLSQSPCFIEGGFEPRHVDLRPFVLHGRQTRIVPGAFCRVALKRGSLVVNSSQGGGGKDMWVLED